MTEAAKGVAAAIAACVIWGLAPLYYKQFTYIDAGEVLSHRILWAFVFFAVLLLTKGQLQQLWQSLATWCAALLVATAAILISVNWFLFIWTIQVGRAVDASLGYYIFPLMAVLIGMVAFGERLSRLQILAVTLAICAVVILTIGLGKLPWISLVLAISFGFYVLLKKRSATSSIVSVTGEVLFLSPLALIWLWGVHFQGWQGVAGQGSGFFGTNWRDSILLILSGPITAGPLILFSYASQRVTMASVGLVQYLNPTLQFGLAVLVFREPFTPYHAIAFALIWLALATYSAQALYQERMARRLPVSEPTSSSTVI